MVAVIKEENDNQKDMLPTDSNHDFFEDHDVWFCRGIMITHWLTGLDDEGNSVHDSTQQHSLQDTHPCVCECGSYADPSSTTSVSWSSFPFMPNQIRVVFGNKGK